MSRLARAAAVAIFCLGSIGYLGPVYGAGCSEDTLQALHIAVTGDEPRQAVSLPPAQACSPVISNGFPIPDPACTPGAVNPTLSLDVLRNPTFRTTCVRDMATSAAEKKVTYDWYGIERPADNQGQNQTCELDHLISLAGTETRLLSQPLPIASRRWQGRYPQAPRSDPPEWRGVFLSHC
jgi:hypothetical protein